MIFVKLVLDNKYAIDMIPEEFVRKYYLTQMAKDDLVKVEVKQGEMEEDGCKGADACLCDDCQYYDEDCTGKSFKPIEEES